MRYPEVMLCDLSNVERPLSEYDSEVIDKAYSLINEYCNIALENHGGGYAARIRGDDLRPEIAASAPTRAELQWFKQEVLNRLQVDLLRLSPRPAGRYDARGLYKNKPLIEASDRTIDFHNEVSSFYSRYLDRSEFNGASAFSPQSVYEHHPVWHQVSDLGASKLFVLSAGFPLGLGYMDCTGDRSVFFTEVHRQNDSAALGRRRGFSEIFPDVSAHQSKSWVVIDKAYSGGSLEFARKLLQMRFGSSTHVVTVALFPKSLSAVASADYMVYAGRLIRVKDVIQELDAQNWHRQLLYYHA